MRYTVELNATNAVTTEIAAKSTGTAAALNIVETIRQVYIPVTTLDAHNNKVAIEYFKIETVSPLPGTGSVVALELHIFLLSLLIQYE